MSYHDVKQAGQFLLRVHDSLCEGLAHIAAWMTLAMIVGIGYEVCMRYFFTRPTRWAADFTDYTLLYTTFLAAAWLAKHGQHVNLTFLLDRLSPKSQRLMEAFNSLFCALVSAFVIWYGARDTWDAYSRGITMVRPIPFPKFLLLGIVPFGYFFLFVQFIRNGIKSLGALKRNGPKTGLVD